MDIILKRVENLKTPDKNVRIHSERQIKEYIRSIKMFGQIRPMVVDENNVVLCGNGLLSALKKMGVETAECYVVQGLSEKQKKKLMLADNKIFELGSNDISTFDKMLAELGGDIDVPGYDEDLLRALSASVEEIEDNTFSSGGFRDNNTDENVKKPVAVTAKMTIVDNQDFSGDDRLDQKPILPAENFNCTCPKCGYKFKL